MFVLIISAIAVKCATSPINVTKIYTISATELGITNYQRFQAKVGSYKLKNEKVIGQLKKMGLTYEEFVTIITVESYLPSTGQYLDMEFTTSNTDLDYEPLYQLITDDIIQHIKS